MDIPDTPQALVEASSERTLTLICPEFHDLHPRDQRLVRLIHAELLKGALSDTVFTGFLATIVSVWSKLITDALDGIYARIESSDEIDEDWIAGVSHFTRMDQYHRHLFQIIDDNPGVADSSSPASRYRLSGPGDTSPENAFPS